MQHRRGEEQGGLGSAVQRRGAHRVTRSLRAALLCSGS